MRNIVYAYVTYVICTGSFNHRCGDQHFASAAKAGNYRHLCGEHPPFTRLVMRIVLQPTPAVLRLARIL